MVTIEHLNKSIGKTPILRDVSFHIAQGEVVGLLGPNGAGKSTLMKVLTGLWKGEGVVRVCGVDVLSRPDAVHAHIGYLPEHNPLYVDMYVREYLMFISRLRKREKSEVEMLIERVGLGAQSNKRIKELSKGYRQRVGLAAAMIGNPEVLILDEPTTGLDPNQLEGMRSLIRELGKDHTVILSTHVMQEVSEMCGRILLLSHGVLQADRTISSSDDLEQLFHTLTQ